MDEYIYACALHAVLLFRPRTASALVEKFGSAKEVFNLSENDLAAFLDRDTETARMILSSGITARAREEVKWAASKGVEILVKGACAYPRLLEECADAPLVLYYKGSAGLNNTRTIAVVGTRLASGYGKECCRRIMTHLKDAGKDPLIISGLAYGIDIAAQKAALEHGLDTVAVLPGGLDILYPAKHREIAKQMIRQGGVITEFPRGMPPVKINFIKRNRIIAGMSQAVIVVESRIKGGAMSTVEFANSYNRDIFAVPGRLDDANSYGCNYLISRNVAAIYSNASVLPAALGWPGGMCRDTDLQPGLFSFDPAEKEKILLSLKSGLPVTVDSIVSFTGFGFDRTAGLLLDLELEGRIMPAGGGRYVLRK